MSKETEKKKNYYITDELLDVLCNRYLQAQCEMHEYRKRLLELPSEDVKTNLARAHGYGDMLKEVLNLIPNAEERMYGRDIRRSAWLSLFGTECRGSQGQGRTGTQAKGSRRNPGSTGTLIKKKRV